MFTIKECTDKNRRCGECCGECKFLPRVPQYCRIFAFDDGGVKAAGAISLEGGDIVYLGVFGNVSEPERDLITRAVLNVCKGLNPITVRVNEVSDYYAQFGFTECGGIMKILNKDIKFV